MLLYVGDKAFGHCSTHTTTMNSETKDRAVKPAASAAKSSGLWKQKGVTGLSISISADGLVFSGEEETGYPTLVGLWKKGQSVQVKCMERGKTDKPYLAGSLSLLLWNVQTRRRMMQPTASVWKMTASLRRWTKPPLLVKKATAEILNEIF